MFSFSIIINMFEVIIFENPSMSLNRTLSKNEKVEYHIKMKIYKFIIIRFWVKSSVNSLSELN